VITSKANEYSDVFSLKNRTAFIMGGKGLLGSEITKAISSYDANTIILDINEQWDNDFDNIIYKYFDCSNLDNIETALNDIIDEFGCPDVFINCSYPRTDDWKKSSFTDISLHSYQKNIDIHLNSYVWLAKLIANHMVTSRKKSSIIQLGSIYGILGQDLTVYEGTEMKENKSYSVIKGGITNLTRQMASVYGQYGIRVNTICSGGIRNSNQDATFVDQYSRKVPLGRLANASEVASTALFLASDAASYITGATITVDGGWTAV